MRITTNGRRCNLRPSFVEMAEKRLEKFDRFFHEEANAAVTASVEKDRYTVEITIKSNGFIFRTERTASNMDAAFDEAADLMMRQIVKNKKKLGNRVHTKEVDLLEEQLSLYPDLEEGQDYRIVREKSFRIEPMTEQEAILQMDMLGHEFYAFRNSHTGELNIVYKRDDNETYGLLIPKE